MSLCLAQSDRSRVLSLWLWVSFAAYNNWFVCQRVQLIWCVCSWLCVCMWCVQPLCKILFFRLWTHCSKCTVRIRLHARRIEAEYWNWIGSYFIYLYSWFLHKDIDLTLTHPTLGCFFILNSIPVRVSDSFISWMRCKRSECSLLLNAIETKNTDPTRPDKSWITLSRCALCLCTLNRIGFGAYKMGEQKKNKNLRVDPFVELT